MVHSAGKLVAELRNQAAAIGLRIARLSDGEQSPAIGAVEQTLRECIDKLRAVRTALAAEPARSDDDDPERCDDDDDAA